MKLADQVRNRIQAEIKKYPAHRKRIRAEILLQELVDDGIIDAGDCRYRRNSDLERDGLQFVIRKDGETLDRFEVEFVDADTNS